MSRSLIGISSQRQHIYSKKNDNKIKLGFFNDELKETLKCSFHFNPFWLIRVVAGFRHASRKLWRFCSDLFLKDDEISNLNTSR